MTHETAERTNAVERYLLDEFTSEERQAFEEHMFDCRICGEHVRRSTATVDNLKEIYREDQVTTPKAVQRERASSRAWLEWLRIPVLVPLAAALCLAAVVAYQSFVYIPFLQQPQVLSTAVIAPVSRDRGPTVYVDRNLPRFNLNFEVDAPQAYSEYTCEFRKDNGTVMQVNAPAIGNLASFTLDLLLPAKRFPSGSYTMILRPTSAPQTELHRYGFVIQDGDTRK